MPLEPFLHCSRYINLKKLFSLPRGIIQEDTERGIETETMMAAWLFLRAHPEPSHGVELDTRYFHDVLHDLADMPQS